MPSLNTFLESVGLTATESSIYLYGLKKVVIVDDLVAALDIKKSTVYHALSTLQDKGLTTSTRRDGRLYFNMTPAADLSGYLAAKASKLEQQQVTLEKLLPLFPVPTTQGEDNYRVEHYSSIEGIKKVVDIALACKDPQWRIIAPRHNFFSEYDNDYAAYFMSKRRVHKIKAKTLWEAPVSAKAKGSLTLGDMVTRNPRYLPPEYSGAFKSVIILFDDKIAFISSVKNSEALLIQSQEFSATMQVMFDGLWATSKEFLGG